MPACNRLEHNRHSDSHAWNQAGIGPSDNNLPMILLVENFVVSRLDIDLPRTSDELAPDKSVQVGGGIFRGYRPYPAQCVFDPNRRLEECMLRLDAV